MNEALPKSVEKTTKMDFGTDSSVTTTFGNWTFVEPSDVEAVEDAEQFYRSENLNTPEKFVGMVFHIIQQMGGKLMYKGKEVSAENMSDTSGDPLPRDTMVNYGGKKVKFSELL